MVYRLLCFDKGAFGRNQISLNSNPSAVLVLLLLCSDGAVIRTQIPGGMAVNTTTVSRRRGLFRKFLMRASSNLILKALSECGHSPSYNGAFGPAHAHQTPSSAKVAVCINNIISFGVLVPSLC